MDPLTLTVSSSQSPWPSTRLPTPFHSIPPLLLSLSFFPSIIFFLSLSSVGVGVAVEYFSDLRNKY